LLLVIPKTELIYSTVNVDSASGNDILKADYNKFPKNKKMETQKKTPTFGESFRITASWWVVDLLWCTVILLFLNYLLGSDAIQSIRNHPFI